MSFREQNRVFQPDPFAHNEVIKNTGIPNYFNSAKTSKSVSSMPAMGLFKLYLAL